MRENKKKRRKKKGIYLLCVICLLATATNHIYMGDLRTNNVQTKIHLSEKAVIPPTTWNKTYSRWYNDNFYSGLETPEGDLVFLGTTLEINTSDDFWLMKTDPNGEIIWEKTFGSEQADSGSSIIQTEEGHFLLAGFTYQHNSADGWLIKTSSEGELIWNKTYGYSGEQFFNEIIQTADGGYCIAGSSSWDGWIVKLDACGELLWSQTYGSISNWDEFRSIIQTPDGGYLLVGSLLDETAHPRNFWVLKTDSLGFSEWNLTLGEPWYHECAYSIAQTDDGYVVIGEKNVEEDLGYLSYWLVKITPQGTIEWNQTYGGNGLDFGRSVIQMDDGGFAILGESESFGLKSELWLIRTDNYGNVLWNQTYGYTGFDLAYKLYQTRDNGLILIGENTEGNNIAIIFKIGGTIVTSSPTSYSSHFFLFIPLILCYFTRKKRFYY